ncbi:MAG: hypothetical protein H6648_06875 [Caldilineae bacterium]|nr:hypothetical protein [Caldilineae bacterium]
MASYALPEGFRPLPLAEAFARSDGAAADAQAAGLVALGAALAGEAAPVRILSREGVLHRAAMPAILPAEVCDRLEMPRLGPERSGVPRHRARARLDADFGELRATAAPEGGPEGAPGIVSEDAEPYARLYRRLEQRPGPTRANDLIEACLGHPWLQTRVAAAAAHLLRGRPIRPDLVRILVAGVRGRESLARGLGAATLARFDPLNPILGELIAPRARGGPGAATRTSLVVHGTFARNRAWWQPGGDFHSYLLRGPRDDVYAAADRFEWSGGFSDAARELGATQLKAWLDDKAATRADLFAHSHGGSIAMLASHQGLQARQLVLLSCPVMPAYLPDFDRFDAILSIRVWFDPVILVAGGDQRFDDPRIRERVLPGYDHSSTHDPSVWQAQGLADFIGPKRQA